ncbi:MAG: AgmX/PglI C-terminal domain-containing protein [Myxococcales bacterium]|nr:AgmX/PglI C-terminal domain-containing protein [Myxococcales bacterium]
MVSTFWWFVWIVAICVGLVTCKSESADHQTTTMVSSETPAGVRDAFDGVLAERQVELARFPDGMTRLKAFPRPSQTYGRWNVPWITLSRVGIGPPDQVPIPLDCSGEMSSCKLKGGAASLDTLVNLLDNKGVSDVWFVADKSAPLGVVWPILSRFRGRKWASHMILGRPDGLVTLRVEAGEALPLLFDPRSHAVQTVPQQLREAGKANQIDPRFDGPALAPGVLVHVREAKLDIPADCNGSASKRHARRLISTFTGCYRDAAARGVAKAGEVVLKWATESDGVVLNVEVEGNSAADDSFAECLKLSLKSSRFPSHQQTAATCAMSYKLRMEPSADEKWMEAGEHTNRYPTRFLIESGVVFVQNHPNDPEISIAEQQHDRLLSVAKESAKASGYALLVADETTPFRAVADVAVIANEAGFDRIVVGKPGNYR